MTPSTALSNVADRKRTLAAVTAGSNAQDVKAGPLDETAVYGLLALITPCKLPSALLMMGTSEGQHIPPTSSLEVIGASKSSTTSA